MQIIEVNGCMQIRRTQSRVGCGASSGTEEAAGSVSFVGSLSPNSTESDSIQNSAASLAAGSQKDSKMVHRGERLGSKHWLASKLLRRLERRLESRLLDRPMSDFRRHEFQHRIISKLWVEINCNLMERRFDGDR